MPANPTRPRVSVVIPTYNRAELLRETLQQLTRQSLGPDEFEVIVADDGSRDGTRAVVDSFSDRLRTGYHFQEDLGFRAGAARNGGARLASAPILCFIDTGVLPGPDFLRSHLAQHADGVPAAVSGYAYGYNPDGYPLKEAGDLVGRLRPEEILARFGDSPDFRDVRHEHFAQCGFDLDSRAIPWNMFFTINCSMPTDEFWAVGGFDESFVGWGAEDVELGFRLHRRGLTFRVTRPGWVIEWPHQRPDIAVLLEQLKTNFERYVRRSPEPVMELGWALTGMDRPMFDWNDEYHKLNVWRCAARDLSVAGEIEDALRHAPPGGRVAVVGCGGTLPRSPHDFIAMDFDRDLLAGALGDGRHPGYNSIGLRTPLPDRYADTVVFTSRMSGLWDRWGDDLLAEAARIGTVVVRGQPAVADSQRAR